MKGRNNVATATYKELSLNCACYLYLAHLHVYESTESIVVN